MVVVQSLSGFSVLHTKALKLHIKLVLKGSPLNFVVLESRDMDMCTDVTLECQLGENPYNALMGICQLLAYFFFSHFFCFYAVC